MRYNQTKHLLEIEAKDPFFRNEHKTMLYNTQYTSQWNKPKNKYNRTPYNLYIYRAVDECGRVFCINSFM